MQQNYHRADIVLRIHVASIQDTVHYDLSSKPIRPPFSAGTQVEVRVRQVYKGAVLSKRLTIIGISSVCDCLFLRGGDYVVFLYKQGADPQGQYVTSTCPRHFTLRDAAARREFAHARQAEK